MSEINFIWSLITEHALWCVPHASLNCSLARPPPPISVIFKAILRPCVIICDIAWHVPEDSLSPFYRCSLPLSSFHFCLIKKPNQAGVSERITSRSSRMFEDAKATRGKHADGSESWSQHPFILFVSFLGLNFAPFDFDQPGLPGVFKKSPNSSRHHANGIICKVLCSAECLDTVQMLGPDSLKPRRLMWFPGVLINVTNL